MFARTIGKYDQNMISMSVEELDESLPKLKFQESVPKYGTNIVVSRRVMKITKQNGYLRGVMEYEIPLRLTLRESAKTTKLMKPIEETRFWINPSYGIVLAENSDNARMVFKGLSLGLSGGGREDVVTRAKYDLETVRAFAREITHAGWRNIRGLGNVTSAQVGGPDIDTAADYKKYDNAGEQSRITLLLEINGREAKITVYKSGSVLFWSAVTEEEVFPLVDNILRPALVT